MGNFGKTKQRVTTYVRARTPLVILASSERERAERMLTEIAAEDDGEFLYYTDAKQVCTLGRDIPGYDVDSDPLPYMAESFKKKRGLTFAFGDVKRVGEDNAYTREILNILYIAKENNGTLLLITADSVWPRLAQFGMQTTLDYPDDDERDAQIHHFVKLYSTRLPIQWQESDVRRAATLLRGFTEIQIENILSSELVANKGLKPEHIYALTAQKSRLYASVPCIQPVQVDRDMEISGLGGLMGWLDEKQQLFFASEEALHSRDLQTPKGLLLAGVPGCGKSFSAKMIAHRWELPLFRFDIGAVYDKWVGESEKKMREALQLIDNVAPCVVWIDEIEKLLATSNEGNDTGKRVLGQFLFWLQESESRVFMVATANDISLLPTELFRKGRFSEVFFIDLPCQREREAAIAQYSRRSLHYTPQGEEMLALVAASRGFSYSDIEYAVKDVAQLALVQGQQVVTFATIAEKFRAVVSISQSNPEMITAIREWGNGRATPASLEQEENL